MPFTATYHGTCTDCDETIAPGQRIERDPDDTGWQHVNCAAPPDRVDCVCERCFLIHAPYQAGCA
ncbi:hypothetical protein [uncultured Jatrophihabitans sp.]|uniref:hypothetical protein n=1 Tax=uncultured Jatrophihabitans sp. TaxID=1610747 RepID=UPI0035C9708F